MMKKERSAFRSMIVGCSLLLAAWLLGTGSARACYDNGCFGGGYGFNRGRFVLALDLDYATALSLDLIGNGGGGALRVGTVYNYFLVNLVPELLFDYHSFGWATFNCASVVTGKVGGRIRFFEILEPGIFAHVGVGNVRGNDGFDRLGLAVDWGLTLDLTVIPFIDLGVHASWNRVLGGFATGYYALTGFHIALVL